MTPAPIEARGLRKAYGAIRAVDDISLSVSRGEIVMLVGPNGAGKTTLLEMLAGLRAPDGGVVRVLGEDPVRASAEFRNRIGVQPQPPAGFFNHITPREALWLFSSFYRRTRSVDELLSRFDLQSKADTQYAHLSGGQRQRLALAIAVMHEPDVLFLDEPTNGLDPESRRDVWRLLRQLRAAGTSVLLSTHNIDEAEPSSDRVGVVCRGRLVALGSPQQVIAASGAESRIDIYVGPGDGAAACASHVPGISRLERENGLLRVFAASPHLLIDELRRPGGPLAALTSGAPYQVITPRLEDAYLKFTAPDREI